MDLNVVRDRLAHCRDQGERNIILGVLRDERAAARTELLKMDELAATAPKVWVKGSYDPVHGQFETDPQFAHTAALARRTITLIDNLLGLDDLGSFRRYI